MKKHILFTLIIFLSLSAGANSINPAAYHVMSATSYRNNYNRQVINRPMPYWQAQSNYSTRNRMYNNYSNYNNSLYRYNSSVKFNRRF